MRWTKYEAVHTAIERGYSITDDGEVYRGDFRLNPWTTTNGYPAFSIKRTGERKCRPVHLHHLMAFKKFGDAALMPGIEVRHLDGNKKNCSKSNIEIGTNVDNWYDRPVAQREAMVAAGGRALRSLDDNQLAAFRADRKSGATYAELSAKYKLSKSSVSYIVTGKLYKN